THKVLIEKKSQQFELHLPATQLIIHADIDRLRQVLLNVIRNACDAADEKSTIKIVLREDELSPGAYIEISNNGDCIPENLLPKIFEPFITTKAGGTGLGLGIVKRITEAHGGQITINSEQGGVTRVVIELPV
ncbi:MAG: ATP-binding protein, partial [Gammaproteobacteria bacterium]|nr:ATP-binding protein [Gammaproteobacteria bacterium]